MPQSLRRLPPIAIAVAIFASFPFGSLARPAAADPTPGFVQHWAGTSTATWGGGSTYANPGTGGVLGAGDGFLMISTPGPAPFFSRNLGASSSDPAYTGNWKAAGITRVQLWLEDVGNPDPLEIHFGLGSSTNFWQYDTGFIPPAGSWGQFTVTIGDGAGWTQTIANPGGTFDDAFQNVAKVLVRHDRAPYVQNPDTITADVGVDELMLIADASSAVAPPASIAVRPVALAPPYPNPSRGAVVLAMETFDASPIRLEILDAGGRLVRRAALVGASPGPRLWTWDGRTDGGAPAPAGYYRVRAVGAAGGTSRPLVRLGTAR